MTRLYEKQVLNYCLKEPDYLFEDNSFYRLEVGENRAIAIYCGEEVVFATTGDSFATINDNRQLLADGIFVGIGVIEQFQKLETFNTGLKVLRYRLRPQDPVCCYYFKTETSQALDNELDYIANLELIDMSKSFVLSGKFIEISRGDLYRAIKNHQGQVLSAVSKNCDYVVIGSQKSPGWKFGDYGTKINKALEINRNGGRILFVSESQLTDYLKRR